MNADGTLGERIKWYRIMKGMSQEKLAELAFSSQSQISAWETDERVPDEEQLQLIGKALNVKRDVFYPPDPVQIEQAIKYLEWLRHIDTSEDEAQS